MLNSLMIVGNDLSTVSLKPLAKLYRLESLCLNATKISDVAQLVNIVNLRNLHIQSNKISDISPLIELPYLNDLILNDNPIADYTQFDKFRNDVGIQFNNKYIKHYNNQ